MKILIFLFLFFSACSSDVNTHTTPNNTDIDHDNTKETGIPDTSDPTTDMGTDVDMGTDPIIPTPVIVGDNHRTFSEGELVECGCTNPNDACSTEPTCILKEHGCISDSDCPTEYRCFSNRCRNEREGERAVRCELDVDCPLFFKCNNSNYCSMPRDCKLSQECASNEVCGEVPDHGDIICRTPGPSAGGETCETGYECISGYCENGQCTSPCVRNDECPEDHTCHTDGHCSPTPSPERRAGCDGVMYGGQCASRWCRINSDCPGTTCSGITCSDEPESTLCKDTEFYRPQYPGKCSSYPGCGSDSECESPYSCVFGYCTRDE